MPRQSFRYSVNGTSDRPEFEIPSTDTEFYLPGPGGGVLNHGDQMDVHAVAANAAGIMAASLQLVHVLEDPNPPPAIPHPLELVAVEPAS